VLKRVKTTFEAKFWQALVQRRQGQGFTLIELLVVIIIIGILSSIALPSFLSQANKAKEAEAKQFIGASNRAQQAYYLERSQFAMDFPSLGIGIKTSTNNFTYAVDLSAGSPAAIIRNVSYPRNAVTLRAHTGAVEVDNVNTGVFTAIAILCQSQRPSSGNPAGVTPSAATGSLSQCNTGWEDLNK